jgi:hypothetical protein
MERHRTGPRGQIKAANATRMRRFNWLLLLACIALPAAGSTELSMELTAGLGGQVVSGRSSELGIRLFAGSATRVELQFSDRNGDTTIPVTLDAHNEKRLWIPVSPAARGPLQVRLLTDAGEVVESELRFAQDDTPITIVSRALSATRFPVSSAATGIRPVVIAPDGFPHSFQAYAGVAAMVTDLASLSGLSTDQYRAFAKYLGGCNLLLVSAASKALLQQLRELAGCGGRFISGYEDLEQVPALLQTLAAARGLQSPSAQNLSSLLAPGWRDEMATSLTLYLAGYIVFIALINWRMKKIQYLLLLPVAVAVAGVLAWSGNGASRSVSWVEAQSGDSHASVTTLLQLGGDRRGGSSAAIDDDAALSRFGGGPPVASIRYAQPQGRRLLSVQTTLLEPAAWRMLGVRRQALPYSLQMRQGVPEVVRRTDPATDRATLMWQGYTYPVPELAKGESWRPHETRKLPALSAAEKLLQRYLQPESPALLLPFTSRLETLAAQVQDHGFVVIRYDPGQTL